MAFWLNSVGHYQAGKHAKAEKTKKPKPAKPRAGLPAEAFVFNCRFQFHKRSPLFVGANNEPLAVAAMRVSNQTATDGRYISTWERSEPIFASSPPPPALLSNR